MLDKGDSMLRSKRHVAGNAPWTPRVVLAVLGAALAIAFASLAMAPNARAGVGCYGDYCSGMDPASTGCAADAQTVAWEDLVGARLELRWSPACKTNWARYQQYPRGWYLGNAPLALRAVQDTGYTQTLDYGVGSVQENTTTWSPMIYSPVHLVHAELLVYCGDATLLGAAADCAANGVIKTDAR
jgi:hypothetical protein